MTSTPLFSRLNRRWLPPLLLGLAILLFAHRMAFSNLILARGDTFLYFYPYWQAAAEALLNGRIPLWNPHLFMGAPFLANSQVGFFYPLNWPLWLLLSPPYAVKASILLHLLIAAGGTYLAGRRVLALSRSGAWLAAVLFALGGYLTAQVEHVNQLQGLAWLPWFLVALHDPGQQSGRRLLREGVGVALLFALQLLAGHMQTAFITGVGLGVYQLVRGARRQIWQRLGPLALGGGLALLLTAVQLLSTLELSSLSGRQGGLPVNETLSFSLHPLLLTRSLLPSYGQSLFTEYVAFLPLGALLLAILGGWQWRGRQAVAPLLAITLAGLLLAAGRFNPLYWLLARLPGFNLFRAPARWLVLYALSAALLAGVGWDRWWAGGREIRPLRLGLLLLAGIGAWGFLSVPLARFLPTGPEAPVMALSWVTLVGWVGEVGLLAAIWFWHERRGSDRLTAGGVGLVMVTVLFLASRTLPYHNLTTPEAYFDVRPSVARLQALTGCVLPEQCPVVPGRLLSLSDIFFDPGDLGEITAVYENQLSSSALYDYTIAIKQKEIVAPNLPLAYGVYSVDGFDGGVLPLNSYSHLSTLITNNNKATTDGRLREQVTAVPEPRWLDLFNARYLITDKVGDTWRDVTPTMAAYFDLQHPVTMAPGEETAVGHLPDFSATDLYLIAHGRGGHLIVSTDAGATWTLTPERVEADLWRVSWPETAVGEAVTLRAGNESDWEIQGLTLVNAETETFQALVPGQYRLIHSGDVKIYENLDVLPRAFVVHRWEWQPDGAANVAAMRQPGFEPGQTAVLTGAGPISTAVAPIAASQVTTTQYTAERVVQHVNMEEDGLLLLTDAYYPGWQATVNGESVPVYQADTLFRAIFLAPGQNEVVWEFRSRSFENGRLLSVAGLVLWLLLAIVSYKRPSR